METELFHVHVNGYRLNDNRRSFVKNLSLRGEFANEDVAEADFGSVGLKLDRSTRDERLRAIEIVIEDLVIDRELVVQPDRYTRPYHLDMESVPLTDGVV